MQFKRHGDIWVPVEYRRHGHVRPPSRNRRYRHYGPRIDAAKVSTTSTSVTIGGGGTGNITITSTTAGSLVFLWNNGQAAATAVAHSGNAWTQITTNNGGEFGNRPCSFWYYPNIGAGVTTVTLTGTAFLVHSVVVGEYSGVATASPVDVSDVLGTWASGGSWTSNSVTPTSSISVLMISAIFAENDGVTLTGGSSFTNQATRSGDIGHTIGFEDRIVTSTSGSYTASGTTSAGGAHGTIVVFKAAAAAGRTTKNTRGFTLGTEAGMNWRGNLG